MTLSVAINQYDFEHKISYPKNVMRSKEQGGGNDIHVQEHSGRVNIHMSNSRGYVDITHRTSENLIHALVNDREGEFIILQFLELKAKSRQGLTYSNRWKRLTEKDTQCKTL